MNNNLKKQNNLKNHQAKWTQITKLQTIILHTRSILKKKHAFKFKKLNKTYTFEHMT